MQRKLGLIEGGGGWLHLSGVSRYQIFFLSGVTVF